MTFVSSFDNEDENVAQQTTEVSDANAADGDEQVTLVAMSTAAESLYTTAEFLASSRRKKWLCIYPVIIFFYSYFVFFGGGIMVLMTLTNWNLAVVPPGPVVTITY